MHVHGFISLENSPFMEKYLIYVYALGMRVDIKALGDRNEKDLKYVSRHLSPAAFQQFTKMICFIESFLSVEIC